MNRRLKLNSREMGIANSIVQKYLNNQKKHLNNIIKITSINESDTPIITRKRCLARIHSNEQCSRKCKDNNDTYCGGHTHSLPYGSINDPHVVPDILTEKKSRGRKSKHKDQNIDIENVDLTKYIATKLHHIDDKHLLIDENGVLFANNDANTIVGRMMSDGSYIWF